MQSKVKKIYILFSTYCTLLLLLSETHWFLQILSFWEVRCALIGQLSSASWLAEYLKRETEMLRLLPYCDAVSRRRHKNNKTHYKRGICWPSGYKITDYNDLYCLFTSHVASRHVNFTMSPFVIGESYSTLLKTRVWIVSGKFFKWENILTGCESEAADCPCNVGIAPFYRNSLCASQHCRLYSPVRFRKYSSVKCASHTLIFGLDCSGTVL